MISGIIFVIRNGLRWRDAPKATLGRQRGEDLVEHAQPFAQRRSDERLQRCRVEH